MPLHEADRKDLQRVVTRVRTILTEDFTIQCKTIYGIQPDGAFVDLALLGHLSEEEKTRATVLRDRIAHLAATLESQGKISDAVDRVLREQAFTVLNRLCALRMCEERGLLQECVRKGFDSKGFRLFEENANQLGGETWQRYSLYLSLLWDELSVELGILFDRFAATAVLFPCENALKESLGQLNQTSLRELWADDETIGWIYQYFNPPEERKAMRKDSPAPQNSRELAVRNQFFTPRYVVEFLTQNTLGRIWYEMRKGDTALRDTCPFLVRRPNEVFLPHEEEAPAAELRESELPQEALLNEPVYIKHRPKKDPRDLRIIDPASGSGHFLLFAFDLLELIYEEAWADAECPSPEVSGRALREEYPTIQDLRRAAPKLIIEHNLHGIDIDGRAVQIAVLALWLRAQQTWKRLGVQPAHRPQIKQSNIVTAEPMLGEDEMRREFILSLRPTLLGQLVALVFEKMRIAGEAGSLLKIEEEIRDAVARAKLQWIEGPKLEQVELFPELAKRAPEQQQLRFDLTGVTDEQFWEQAEDRILAALKEYSEGAQNGYRVRRRLFVEDAARGFAFVDLCRKRYSVTLMNPPFGMAAIRIKDQIAANYPRTKNDLFAAFVERGVQLLCGGGMLGAITSRAGFFLASFQTWREDILLKEAPPAVVADLGYGVLDNAMVQVAAYCLEVTR